MKNLNAALIEESLKLDPDGAYLWLIELAPNPVQAIYLVCNNQGITFDGKDYEPFPLTLELGSDSSTGEIASASIGMSLVGMSVKLKEILRGNRYYVDSNIIIRRVHTAHLADSTAQESWTFAVTSAPKKEGAILFALGGFNWFGISIPFVKYVRNRCQNRYEDFRCQYVANTLTVVSSTNASPTVITVNDSHALATGQKVTIAGHSVGGYNGDWTVTRISATTFSLDGSTAAGAGTGGTAVYSLPTCDFTLRGPNGCRAHQNNLNFRAVPGTRRPV